MKAIFHADSMVYHVTFRYDPGLISKIKTLPGYRWNPKEKEWLVPFSEESKKKLTEWGFLISAPMGLSEFELPPLDLSLFRGFKADKLYPYQKEGIQFIESRDGRALIADSMGLGKSLQALGYCALHPEKCPVVIVCPASLKYNWKNEIMKWYTDHNFSGFIMSGAKKTVYEWFGDEYNRQVSKARFVIVNYDILSFHVNFLASLHPSIVIFDESHNTRNDSAKRTKASLKLAQHSPHVLCLSGTPIVNKPIEMYNAIRMVKPDLFANKYAYGYKYCGLHRDRFGYQWGGATNTSELHNILKSTIMIRRKKEEVLKDLPGKIRSVLSIGIDNKNQYDQISKNFLRWVAENKGLDSAIKAANAEFLVKLNTLAQIAYEGKKGAIKEWIENFFEENPDKKLVVFGINHKALDFIREVCQNGGYRSVTVDGQVDAKQRQENVDAFQNDPSVKVFIGNVKAAGVGITLTAADTVLFVQLAWTPGEMEQAEDRLNRIGAKYTTNVYYLVAKDTVEEHIVKVLNEKMDVLGNVLDGKEAALGSSLIKEAVRDALGVFFDEEDQI